MGAFLAGRAALAPLLFLSTAAWGQPERQDWEAHVGPAIRLIPNYPGAEDYRWSPLPALDINYRDRLFLNSQRGLGAYLVNDGESGFRLGASLWYRSGRKETRDPRLAGLGDIEWAPQLRGFVAQSFGPLDASITVARDLGGSEGMTVELGTTLNVPVGGGAALSAGPSLTYGDRRFQRAWFGISEAQSLASGLPVYRPGASFYRASFSGFLVVPIDRRWRLIGFAGVDRLLGDAANSPIVQRTTTPSGAVAVTYRIR